MILEAWDIELEQVHSFAIILSENDTVMPFIQTLDIYEIFWYSCYCNNVDMVKTIEVFKYI